MPVNSDITDSLPELHKLAIDAALSSDWIKAEEINKKIIKIEPENTECLNRLGRALLELEKVKQAKKTYQSVLKLDPYNSIAQKNLKRLQSFREGVKHTNNSIISPSLFLEEAGITKVVNLVKLAEPQRLSRLYPGALVVLVPKNRGISVTDLDNNYLGALTDDLSHSLMKLIKGGNKYQSLIKSVKPNSLTILIRETYRSRRFKNQPSFLDNSKAFAYSSDNITLSFSEMSADSGESESEESTE